MSKELSWTPLAWSQYVYWQSQDLKTLKRINRLIEEACRSPFEGIGKPEKLRGNLSGLWSRRIDEQHRLVYPVEENRIVVIQCRYRY